MSYDSGLINAGKLSIRVSEIIENTHQIILVSAISYWEISLKYSVGKLDLRNIRPEDFPQLAIVSGFRNIPLIPEEAASYHYPEGIQHNDPYDKMLIRQAMMLRIPVISNDRKLADTNTSGLNVIW